MLEFSTLKFKDIQMAKGIVFEDGSNLTSFYSFTKKSITYFTIIKGVYIATRKDEIIGILVIDSGLREFYFYPTLESENIRLSEFIDSLDERFELSGYIFNFVFNDYNYIKGSENKYELISSVKFMVYDLEKLSNDKIDGEYLNVRNYTLRKDEKTRVYLQNEIFGDVEGRADLTLKDVMIEEYSPKFIEDLCFILEENAEPIGYGQIINIGEEFYLVNFGIIPSARRKGYAKKFLSHILACSYEKGINQIELTVDNYNRSAVELYKSFGFIEKRNTMKIRL